MSNLSEATREIMWNISHGWLMYVFLAIALGIFARGLAKTHQDLEEWKG